jgi:hypothetical protein
LIAQIDMTNPTAKKNLQVRWRSKIIRRVTLIHGSRYKKKRNFSQIKSNKPHHFAYEGYLDETSPRKNVLAVERDLVLKLVHQSLCFLEDIVVDY